MFGSNSDDGLANSSYSSSSGSIVYELTADESTLNSSYCLPSGQVIYQVETPKEEIAPVLTTIKRIRPDALVDTFSIIALLHHNIYDPTSTQFEFGTGGNKVTSDEIFRKDTSWWKSSSYGRDRICRLLDGREARWSLGGLKGQVCKLVTNDASKTSLAVFHQQHMGVLHSKCPMSLEIFPAALLSSSNHSSSSDFSHGILTEDERRNVDFILITFLYMEKIRKDRETLTAGVSDAVGAAVS